MSLHIQMVGTGNAFAKRYFNNNAIVSTDKFRLLIDCGATAPYSLHHMGISLTGIDGIMVTHIHGDHIGGLEEVAFQMKYVHKRKLPLFVPSALVQTLWDASLRGALDVPSEGCTSLDCYFDVVAVDALRPVSLHETLTVELIPTVHIPDKPSFALLINELLFYSSDMTFDPQLLIRLAESGRCKHILHECQLTGPGLVHTTLEQLRTLPEPIQERIWLMHYEDDKDRFVGHTGRMRFLEQHLLYVFD